MAEGRPGRGEAAPGDHLQTGYQLWLVGHQLERGRAPWRDPYSFQPLVEPRANFAGWPFGLPYWPLERALGTVAGWNAFVLLGFLGAGGFAALWLRELGVRRGAALAGGLAFCLAPYLAGQASAGHLLAWVAMLLPLALFAWERGVRRSPWWLAVSAGALASIPLSGQLHFALGALPFFLVYALARGRALPAATGAVLLAVGAGVLVYFVAVRGTVGAGGRSFAQVERYSADAADFVSRDVRHGIESFVFLGWLTPLLAVAGLALLLAQRRIRLAVALGLGAVVPVLLALGANLPGYETVWRNLPGLRETRVPERLMPVACLALAALVGFAITRVSWPGTAALVAVLLLVDLRVGLFERTAADEGNRAYAALGGYPRGRLLELPVFLPDRQEGSVYLYYLMQAPRERVAGYSTTAPRAADEALRELRAGICGAPAARRVLRERLRRLNVRFIALHEPLYPPQGCEPAAPAGRGVRDGGIVMLRSTSP
jgi:hypothetical protein